MRKIQVIECEGTVKHDPTSSGYQYSVELLTDEYEDEKALRWVENKKVKVRIEIEEDQ